MENDRVSSGGEKDMTSIRTAVPEDARQIAKIYRPYVERTAITFEYEAPDAAEICRRMMHTLEKYPFLAACDHDEILGYAYAGPFKERAAYDHCAEVSIYLDEHMRGRGIGRQLYAELERVLKKQNIFNLYACIAYPEKEDTYLTRDSVYFHEKMGYSLVGECHRCGYKFGRWYNMVWMEKMIGERSAQPGNVIPFRELKGQRV